MNIRNPIVVRTLLGLRSFAESLQCLGSLLACAADPIRLIIHEDGTLANEHRDQLRGLGPQIQLLPRSEADALVSARLRRHPRCRAARSSSPLFLKLFDVPLLAGTRLAYCDSDVLFIHPFAEVFSPPVPPAAPLAFMTDATHAFAVRPWRAWPAGPVRLGGWVNTGLIVGDGTVLDLDYLEWLLGILEPDKAYARRPYWAEQTCWAAIAARSGFALFDSRRLVLADAALSRLSAQTVAIHFISTYRDRLAAFQDRQPARTPPVTIARQAGRDVSTAGLFWADFRRWAIPA
jgi:hypothetical protein